MSEHYFSSQPASPAEEFTFNVEIAGREYAVTSSHGVFSYRGLDKGTRVFLTKVPDRLALDEYAPSEESLALDLGCGWGPISLALAERWPGEVWSVDVNERARHLTAVNMKVAGYEPHVYSPQEAEAALEGRRFDLIWSNPPVRIGKAELHALLLTWLAHLSERGAAYFVVQKNLGADSLSRWLCDQGFDSQKMASAAGFRILRVRTSA